MNLMEQFNYLVDHGIITIAEETSKNIFEHSILKEFKVALEYTEEAETRIAELEEQLEDCANSIGSLEDTVEDLKYRLHGQH